MISDDGIYEIKKSFFFCILHRQEEDKIINKHKIIGEKREIGYFEKR